MIRLMVLYGHPTDPAEFDRYYYETHIPIAKKMKGLTGWTVGKLTGGTPEEKPPYYFVANLYAENREALDAIIASPEGQAAVADVPNFATGGATFLYDTEEVIISLNLG